MKNAIIASLASIPFAVAGVFSAGAANAAALSGSFHFDGADVPSTTVKFSDNLLDFKPDANSTVSIKLADGDFVDGFAKIFDLTGIAGTDGMNTALADIKFMEFVDGASLFVTMVSDYVFSNPMPQKTTNIGLDFQGYFLSAGGEKSTAIGTIDFQSLSKINANDLKSGGVYSATFSGGAVTSVPEPTTMLGLGVVAAASAFGLKKKNS